MGSTFGGRAGETGGSFVVGCRLFMGIVGARPKIGIKLNSLQHP